MDEKELRRRILSHGKSRDTLTGPEYVGCRCKRCESDRRKLSDIRVKKLADKWNPGLQKLGMAI